MTRSARIGLLIALVALVALGACSQSDPPAALGGETNWLRSCAAQTDCSTGSCLCGVCTTECASSADCTGRFAGACMTLQTAMWAGACGAGAQVPSSGVCLPICGKDADCGKGFTCRESTCVSSAIAGALDMSANASDANSPLGTTSNDASTADASSRDAGGDAAASGGGPDGSPDDGGAADAAARSTISSCPSPVPRGACATLGEACLYGAPPQGPCICRSDLHGSRYWSCYAGCPTSMASGDCYVADDVQSYGITCSYPTAPGGPTACTCSPDTTNQTLGKWFCGAPPMPEVCSAAPSDGQSCLGVYDAKGVGGCLYLNGLESPTRCQCDQGVWVCDSATCPEQFEPGGCDQPGLACRYYGGRTHCTCERQDAGNPVWVCDGVPTQPLGPTCPTTCPAGQIVVNMPDGCGCWPSPCGPTCNANCSCLDIRRDLGCGGGCDAVPGRLTCTVCG